MRVRLSTNQFGFTFSRREKAEALLKLSNKGFTLVELLVAIVIIVILSTIGIAGFNSANARNELQNQAKEIQSELRALRTNSVAAVKPVTGTTVATSCKGFDQNGDGVSDPSEQDQGTYYGTYIILDQTNSRFETGVSCFKSDGTNVSVNLTSTKNLTEGITFSSLPGGGNRRVIFFSFNGNVYNLALASGTPDLAYAQNPTGQISAAETIELTQGSSLFYVRINGAGLICSQINTASTNCAQ